MARRINYIIEEKGLSVNDFVKKASSIAIHSLLLSHSIRKDAVLTIVWAEKGVSIRIQGSRAKNIRPDQESTAGVMKKLLQQGLGKRKRNIERLPCIVANNDIRAKNKETEITFLPIIREKGFSIIDNLEYNNDLCSEKILIPGLGSPLEAIILMNMVLDLCSRKTL
jgi:tRNA pseudouridine-54 N-methylase